MTVQSATGEPVHPKIGMEIEANWPDYSSLPQELRNVFEQAGVHKDSTAAINEFIARHGSSGRSTGEWAYICFKNSTGPKPHRETGTTRPVLDAFYKLAPEKYHFPAGWDKDHDAGVEMRFNGPANTLEKAEELIRRGSKWLRDFGHNTFTGAGTHVHLGHVAWVQETFSDAKDRLVAERLLWGYFASRERALFEISPAHRYNHGYCIPMFNASRQNQSTRWLAPAGTIPEWVFHTVLRDGTANLQDIQTYEFGGSSICNRRKSFPTIEFRVFAGTNCETALIGYVRLLHNMFKRAQRLLTPEVVHAQRSSDLPRPFLVNPYSFNVSQLKDEIKNPWLRTWIDKTVLNRGEPISTNIDEIISEPEHVATV